MTPAFAEAIASWFGNPIKAADDANKVIEPPSFEILFTDDLTIAIEEVRLVKIVLSQSASLVMWAGFKIKEPMQFIIPLKSLKWLSANLKVSSISSKFGFSIRRGLELSGVSKGSFDPNKSSRLEFNEDLEDSPELINSSPYNDGWIACIEFDASIDEVKTLSSEEYLKFIGK